MGHIRDRFGVGSRSSVTVPGHGVTDRADPEHPGPNDRDSGSERFSDSEQHRGPVRSPESGHGHRPRTMPIVSRHHESTATSWLGTDREALRLRRLAGG
jgi:hypothetical protein